MKNTRKSFLFFLFVLGSIGLVSAQPSSKLHSLLKKRLPNATIKILEAKDHFSEAYEIMLDQPLDHKNVAAGDFQQLIYLQHVDRKQPMVMETAGYAARFRTNELSQILKGNQLTVEYRYAGKSKPQKMDWQYLNNDQASDDLHRIKKLFKKIYKKDWVSTGVSKGGQTTLIYKSKYPKDVCVAVPYVAPMPLAQEDKRTDTHQANIGSDECRQKIRDFQRAALKKRSELIPMLNRFAEKNKLSYSIGTDVALEYAVLEFPFSFWQWGGFCDDIPASSADSEAIFDYINKIVQWNFYSDASAETYLPSFYQFITELGYYGFPKAHLEDLLVAVPNPSNTIFAPKGVDLTYRSYLHPVVDYLKKKGDRIIYIYGEYDTWTACGVTPPKERDALKIVKIAGDHSTRIKNIPEEQQQKIYEKLKKWLKVEIFPLEEN